MRVRICNVCGNPLDEQSAQYSLIANLSGGIEVEFSLFDVCRSCTGKIWKEYEEKSKSGKHQRTIRCVSFREISEEVVNEIK